MTGRRHPAHVWVPWLYSLTVAAVIVGPLLRPGYLLLRDAVSTPRSYLTDTALGLSDAAARAVPQDAALAIATRVVDGGLLVTLLLLAALTSAGAGSAAMVRVLLPTARLGSQLLAATATLWNPYVAERLLQGHWSLLLGYAALPWTVCAAVAVRRGRRSGWFGLAAAFTIAGLTPTGVILTFLVAGATLICPPKPAGQLFRRLGALLGLFLLASAPWLTATAVAGGDATSDPEGVAAFAARAEPGLATIGSLAGLGGIWNSHAVPDSRTTLFAVLGTAILLAIIACGVPALWRRRRHPVIGGLTVLAVLAIVAPALAATPWGLEVGRWAVDAVPGTGLLRDAHKWVALAVPAYALAAAAAVLPPVARSQSVQRVQGRRVPMSAGSKVAAAAGAIVLVFAALPDLAWGVGGSLRPVTYSPQWDEVAAQVAAEPGDVAVLPTGMFRIIDGNPALDPAPRMLPSDVLQSGQLVVSGQAVSGEGSRGLAAEQALHDGAAPDDLAALGVRWVLVEHEYGADDLGNYGDAAQTLAQLEPRLIGADLSLYRVPGAVSEHTADSGARTAVIAAHALWAALLLVGIGGLAVARLRAFAARGGNQARSAAS
ncbi:MAG: hypothetical protein GX542_10585 [Rhodococcus sp.]|nr:hypothetical protein [Rhodococcus sp. (in: high G+C Gram-positive bacteria)]